MKNVVQPTHWSPGRSHLGEARDERLEESLGVHPRDHLAEALMDALAEATYWRDDLHFDRF